MILSLADYMGSGLIDPLDDFVPFAQDDEQMQNATLSPAAVIPAELQGSLVRARATSALRLQQHLIYRIGANLGILQSAIPQVVNALQELAPLVVADIEAMIDEAVDTAVGIASDALGWVPLVGWIVRAGAAGVKLGLALDRAMNTPGTMIGRQLPWAQTYSTDTDTAITNQRLIPQSETRDWTSLFMPSMQGDLHAEIRKNAGGNIVIAWGLREGGQVPRVIIDKSSLLSPYTWHFSEDGGSAPDGGNPFTVSGGLGAVPGTTQIIDVTQSAFLEPQNLHRGHETLGDPRCGSDRKTSDVNVGSWYPTTGNGAWSLFGYARRASASSYTIATQEVTSAWQAYADAIWEGVEKLWRNEAWEGGYGCGAWQNALQGLVAAHCVGTDDLIGGFGSWMPTRYQTKLTAADRNAWEANNLVTRLVLPAMMDLREMQLRLLRRTPMAAYLPATGLGAMRDVSVKEAFDNARTSMLTHIGAKKHRANLLRRTDVLDDWYLDQLVKARVGSDTAPGGIEKSDYKPPRTAVDLSSGGGRGAAIAIGVGALSLTALGLLIRSRRRH